MGVIRLSNKTLIEVTKTNNDFQYETHGFLKS